VGLRKARREEREPAANFFITKLWVDYYLKLRPTQCCGAETICFGSSSGSNFQKVTAPELEDTCRHDLQLKKSSFHDFCKIKNTDLSY
jgi:hypothetical protein